MCVFVCLYFFHRKRYREVLARGVAAEELTLRLIPGLRETRRGEAIPGGGATTAPATASYRIATASYRTGATTARVEMNWHWSVLIECIMCVLIFFIECATGRLRVEPGQKNDCGC